MRVLAQTGYSPTIPFVSSVDTPQPVALALQRALCRLCDHPGLAPTLEALRIERILPTTLDEYAIQLEIEAEASALNYCDLA